MDYEIIKDGYKNCPKIIDENVFRGLFGACTYPNNFGFNLVENTMERLIEAGIPQQQLDNFFDFEMKPLEEEPPKEPKVFAFSDVDFGFVVWLVACAISTTVFILEVSWVSSKKAGKNFLALFFILMWIKKKNII